MKLRRILVVDDNVALSRTVKLQLEAEGGFRVRVVNHAGAALAAAREFRPQVAILDVMMPEMDGGHVAAMFRSDPVLADVPVIFLTGSVSQDEVKGRRGFIGGMPFLAKPARIEELLQWINKLAPCSAGDERTGAPVSR